MPTGYVVESIPGLADALPDGALVIQAGKRNDPYNGHLQEYSFVSCAGKMAEAWKALRSAGIEAKRIEGATPGRYGIVSDLHESHAKLEAAIALLRREGVDSIWHLGDVVHDKSSLDRCVGLLIENGVDGVAGNHDYFLCTDRNGKLAKGLSQETVDYMRALPFRTEFGDVCMSHDDTFYGFGEGSDIQKVLHMYDSEHLITSHEKAKPLLEKAPHRLTLVGHTHIPHAYATGGDETPAGGNGKIRLNPEEKYVLNPGALEDGRCAILDLRDGTFELVKI